MSFGLKMAILFIVLLIFVGIFFGSWSVQAQKQKQTNQQTVEAYKRGMNAALDAHGLSADGTDSGAVDEYTRQLKDGTRGTALHGAKPNDDAAAWEDGYRAALKRHSQIVSDTDNQNIWHNPYRH